MLEPKAIESQAPLPSFCHDQSQGFHEHPIEAFPDLDSPQGACTVVLARIANSKTS